MTGIATDTAPEPKTEWPLRPWALAFLLALAGLGIHHAAEWDEAQWQPWRAALTAAFAFGPLALAFTLDPKRWQAPLAFALLVGIFFWTSHVLAFLAKQDVPNAMMFLVMESGYLVMQFAVFGIAIGLIVDNQPEVAESAG